MFGTISQSLVLSTVTGASVLNGLGANIYTREHYVCSCTPYSAAADLALATAAIPQIEEQLHASSGAISLSLALFIFLQGCVPLVWTTLSEFWGRKVSSVVEDTFMTGLNKD